MTVWYAGRNEFRPAYQVWMQLNGPILTCLQDGHPLRVTYTRYRIDTVDSPDDEHFAARNIYRTEINIYKKLCVKLVIYKDYTKMHGLQNIIFTSVLFLHLIGVLVNDAAMTVFSLLPLPVIVVISPVIHSHYD